MELDAIDGDTILASRKSMDRAPPPKEPKSKRRSHRSARLPDDCLKRLFEFAPLSSLLNTLLVSTPWRENALDDPRWDPTARVLQDPTPRLGVRGDSGPDHVAGSRHWAGLSDCSPADARA